MSMPGAAIPIDLGRMLDEAPWSAFQKRLLVFAALAFGVDGMANQVLGLAIPALLRDWGVSRASFAPVAALGLIGVAIGAALGGMLGDRFGRRAGLIGSVLLFGIMTTGTAFVHGMTSLTCLRLLAGLGVGGAIPSGMVFIPVGGLLAGIVATAVLPQFGWRGLFLIAGALPLLLALVFAFVLPESPRFLARVKA